MNVSKLLMYVSTTLLLSGTTLMAEDLQVQITSQNDWGSGFCSDVSVYNPNSKKVAWNISFNAEGEITSLWNAKYSQDTTTLQTTASGLSWNKFVNPQSIVTFGYCANRVQTPPPPPNEGELVITQTLNNEWDGGFCNDVLVTNMTDHDIDWEVIFPVEGNVYEFWNSNVTQNSETLEASANGVDWNNVILANSEVAFGYCATSIEPTPDPDQEALESDKNTLTFDTIKGDNSATNSITADLVLPTVGTEGSTISWSSDNSAITSNGAVTQPAEGQSNEVVHLTATLTNGAFSDTKTFDLVVLAIGETTIGNPLFSNFNIGFGGSYAFPFSSTTAGEKIWVSSVDLVMDDAIESNEYYSSIKNFDAYALNGLQNSLKNSKFLVYWITEGWDESWFNASKIQQAMDAGYVPVFNYWWFGDQLMNGMPDASRQAAYAEDYTKVATFLNKLNGTKLLVMEPEFNKENVLSNEDNQHALATIIGNAIDTIKANTSEVFFSLAMTDTGSRGLNQTYPKCGYVNCALGDQYEWGRPEIIYNDLSDKLDFIAFQQMIGQFSRDPMNAGSWDTPNPIAYSDEDIGIDYLSTRIANFSQFLHEKYNKPVFLPYIAIATATWSDANSNNAIEESEVNYSGWEIKAETTYQDLSMMKEELQNKGLFGFAPMALFDDPRHDYGGYQYFMNNEYHLGIMKSSALDGVDIATNGDIVSKGNIIDVLFN